MGVIFIKTSTFGKPACSGGSPVSGSHTLGLQTGHPAHQLSHGFCEIQTLVSMVVEPALYLLNITSVPICAFSRVHLPVC